MLPTPIFWAAAIFSMLSPSASCERQTAATTAGLSLGELAADPMPGLCLDGLGPKRTARAMAGRVEFPRPGWLRALGLEGDNHGKYSSETESQQGHAREAYGCAATSGPEVTPSMLTRDRPSGKQARRPPRR
jgi:hypothetical protein